MQHGALSLPSGDMLIHAGDWTHRGSENHTIEFLEWLNKQNYKYKPFIAGNHDFYPEQEPTKFRALVAKYAPTCIYLEDESIILDGYKVHGSPVSPWFCDWAFNRYRGKEIQEHWDMIPSDTEILITHGPIYGYGDKLSAYGSEPGERVGCRDLLNTIDTRLKDLKLYGSGHIHEGYGVYDHNGIAVVNASVLTDRYKLKNSPIVVSLPDKTKSPDHT
ncbi:unnamed protein product [Sphagnum balticum]